jgi:hypothetical protein
MIGYRVFVILRYWKPGVKCWTALGWRVLTTMFAAS